MRSGSGDLGVKISSSDNPAEGKLRQVTEFIRTDKIHWKIEGGLCLDR